MKARLYLTYVFNVYDLCCTVVLVSMFGIAAEANPFGAVLFQSSTVYLYKLAVIPLLLGILWVYRGHKLSQVAAWVGFTVYTLLALYHISLIIIGGLL